MKPYRKPDYSVTVRDLHPHGPSSTPSTVTRYLWITDLPEPDPYTGDEVAFLVSDTRRPEPDSDLYEGTAYDYETAITTAAAVAYGAT